MYKFVGYEIVMITYMKTGAGFQQGIDYKIPWFSRDIKLKFPDNGGLPNALWQPTKLGLF